MNSFRIVDTLLSDYLYSDFKLMGTVSFIFTCIPQFLVRNALTIEQGLRDETPIGHAIIYRTICILMCYSFVTFLDWFSFSVVRSVISSNAHCAVYKHIKIISITWLDSVR